MPRTSGSGSERTLGEVAMPADFGRRFDELLSRADAMAAQKRPSPLGSGAFDVDESELAGWIVNVRHLLEMVCGLKSQHFAAFDATDKGCLVRRQLSATC